MRYSSPGRHVSVTVSPWEHGNGRLTMLLGKLKKGAQGKVKVYVEGAPEKGKAGHLWDGNCIGAHGEKLRRSGRLSHEEQDTGSSSKRCPGVFNTDSGQWHRVPASYISARQCRQGALVRVWWHGGQWPCFRCFEVTVSMFEKSRWIWWPAAAHSRAAPNN